MKIYIYGRGLGLTYVNRCINDDVTTIAFIDNFTNDKVDASGIPVIRKNQIYDDYDFILISIMNYTEIKNELISLGVDSEKIVCFFCYEDAENTRFYSVLDGGKWKTELMWKYHREVIVPTFDNLYYETNALSLVQNRIIPNIINVEKTIDLIINEHKCLARFGDGEFEMIMGRTRPRFQKIDKQLGIRLEEVLNSNIPNLLLAIANNYGELTEYTDDAANGIRLYLKPSVRNDHMSLLDLSREYYDAYLSRPYIMFRDKSPETMKKKFNHIRQIWDMKRVLIVEGEHTRIGVGNDLLDNAADIIRVLAPDKNAFSCYEDILSAAQKYGENRLILVTLGPTATVLSHDLAKSGYWVVDIGQIDTEYEWYLRGTNKRCDVPYKTVSEYADKGVFPEIDEPYKSKYEKQIVKVVRNN